MELVSFEVMHAINISLGAKPLLRLIQMKLRVSEVLVFFILIMTYAVSAQSPRDEKLWKRALEIHRKAIVIDTHNDVTTPMTNDDYDLSGPPPVPYRTSIDRMKQGGLTAEFFSLYVRPWYVAHGVAARRTLDMIDTGNLHYMIDMIDQL